jgi:5'-nucleotidase
MRILLTNDDGIQAPGLAALFRAIRPLGEVFVVAPAQVQSATSHAITFHRPVGTRREIVTCKTTAQSFEGIAVEGRPADCVKLGLTYLIPAPIDLVISGMNSGANVGINTIYSGTVAAAREAAFIGTPAIAVSLHIGERSLVQWDKAAMHARGVIDSIIAAPLARHALLNINVPILDAGEPRGVKVVPISTSPLVDTYTHTIDVEGRSHYQAPIGFSFQQTEPDTDVHALYDGYITVTPLHYDLTKHSEVTAWARRLDSK